MRTAITIGIRHEGIAEIIHGPEVPIPDQRAANKKRSASQVDPDYSEVQYWEAPVRKYRFKAPAKQESDESVKPLEDPTGGKKKTR